MNPHLFQPAAAAPLVLAAAPGQPPATIAPNPGDPVGLIAGMAQRLELLEAHIASTAAVAPVAAPLPLPQVVAAPAGLPPLPPGYAYAQQPAPVAPVAPQVVYAQQPAPVAPVAPQVPVAPVAPAPGTMPMSPHDINTLVANVARITAPVASHVVASPAPAAVVAAPVGIPAAPIAHGNQHFPSAIPGAPGMLDPTKPLATQMGRDAFVEMKTQMSTDPTMDGVIAELEWNRANPHLLAAGSADLEGA